MSPYEEIIDGRKLIRSQPGLRHEKICARLHQKIGEVLVGHAAARLLYPRTQVTLSAKTILCPDLALVTVATGKAWLVIEVIDSADHKPDTVLKKGIYEDFKVPRLWMVDPRYDNVEMYHAMPYGLALKGMLAGQDILQEALLPKLKLTAAELFAV